MFWKGGAGCRIYDRSGNKPFKRRKQIIEKITVSQGSQENREYLPMSKYSVWRGNIGFADRKIRDKTLPGMRAKNFYQ